MDDPLGAFVRDRVAGGEPDRVAGGEPDRVAGGEPDRVGLGWRGDLAAGIFAHLDRIDLVELIADDYFKADAKTLRPLQLLSSQVPLTLHGVAMGLAGSEPVDDARLLAMGRLIDALKPESWSEHLAFVRSGGFEIGHLAAPPRRESNVAAAIANIERATRVIAAAPRLENIATLVEPPGSPLSEPAWTGTILDGAGAPMLLDLHNLYANARNTGQSPEALLAAMPLARVQGVHLSGGHWIDEPAMSGRTAGQRLLDDHVHDVPEDVFGLLAVLAARVPQPLEVIIERDGAYPDFDVLLGQVDAARAALARGRAHRHPATLKAAA
ncbi:MAG: DUF692 family protein [Betaproteobacteria bacterium]|nr:DUF692 family protein [Betaproteobacteria bacterium]